MSVAFPGDLIAVVGLSLDVIGVVLLFWVAPEKYPDPQAGAFFAIEPPEIREQWRRNQKLRKWLAIASLMLIALGFVLQGVAIVLF